MWHASNLCILFFLLRINIFLICGVLYQKDQNFTKFVFEIFTFYETTWNYLLSELFLTVFSCKIHGFIRIWNLMLKQYGFEKNVFKFQSECFQ